MRIKVILKIFKFHLIMKINNPVVIPRNHKVEEALEAAEKNDLKPLTQLIEILKDPYTQKDNIFDYRDFLKFLIVE